MWIKKLKLMEYQLDIFRKYCNSGYMNVLRKYPENTGVDIYLAGVKELIPVPIGDDFNYDEIATTMIGRFEQYEFFPKELQDLCIRRNVRKASRARSCILENL